MHGLVEGLNQAYFVAGAAGATSDFAAVPVDFRVCFFECFFMGAVVAEASFAASFEGAAAGAWAANVRAAKARERAMVFMVLIRFPFEALFLLPPLIQETRRTINTT